ncbi:MAG: universal stress protein [Bacteroidota bacterium]
MKVNRILVPTDFSARSEAAVQMAGRFYAHFGTTIDLIHVVPLSMYFSESIDTLGIPFDMEKDLYPHVLEHAYEELKNLAHKHIGREHCGQLITIVDRKPSRAITDQANKNNYDLVLMSSRGKHASEWFRGSITEKIIRQSNVPVLTLDEPIKSEEMGIVFVPIDFSDNSFEALPTAFNIAKQFDAKIMLFHAVELYGDGVPMPAIMAAAEDEDRIYDALIRRMNEFFEEHDEYHIRIKQIPTESEDYFIYQNGGDSHSILFCTQIERGISAHHEIVTYANSHADLAVMTTHGRTGLARFLIGSTAEQVVRNIKIPLLTIRPNGNDD